MNFIELRVEDYIDEVLDSDTKERETEIQVLRKFVHHVDRDTEIYSVQEITEEDALVFLRTLRNVRERDCAVRALNGFFVFLKEQGHVDEAVQLEAQAIFRTKPTDPGSDVDDYLADEAESPRFRSKRGFD